MITKELVCHYNNRRSILQNKKDFPKDFAEKNSGKLTVESEVKTLPKYIKK